MCSTECSRRRLDERIYVFFLAFFRREIVSDCMRACAVSFELIMNVTPHCIRWLRYHVLCLIILTSSSAPLFRRSGMCFCGKSTFNTRYRDALCKLRVINHVSVESGLHIINLIIFEKCFRKQRYSVLKFIDIWKITDLQWKVCLLRNGKVL